MYNNYNYTNTKCHRDRKYRSEIDIIRDILAVFKRTHGNSIGKTKIMYSANLNTRMLSTYLDKLVRQGLIVEEERNGKKIYNITSKGMLTLLFISKLNILLKPHNSGESKNEKSKKIRETISKTLNGRNIVILQDYTVVGESGLFHHFDMLIKVHDKKIAVHISLADDEIQPLEYLWFILGLIDSKMDTGLYVRVGKISGIEQIEQREYTSTKIYQITVPEDKEVIIARLLPQVLR